MISKKNKLLAILLCAVLLIATTIVGVSAAPKGVKITKLTVGKTAKTAKVTFKKVKGAKKYQIRYGYKKNLKVAKVKTVKKTSATLKKLKAGKTLYVKVRAKLKKGYTKFGAVKKVKLVVKQTVTNAPATTAPATVAPATTQAPATKAPTTPKATTTTTTKATTTTTKVTTTTAKATQSTNLTEAVKWVKDGCWTTKNNYTVENGLLVIDSSKDFEGNQYQIGTWNGASFTTADFQNATKNTDGFVMAVKLHSAKGLGNTQPTKLNVAIKIQVDEGIFVGYGPDIALGETTAQCVIPYSSFTLEDQGVVQMTAAHLDSVTNITVAVNSYGVYYGNNFTELKATFSSIYAYKGTPETVYMPGETPVVTTTVKPTTTKAPTTAPTTTEAPDTQGQTVYDMSQLYDSTRVLGRGVYSSDNKTLVCDWVTSGYEVGVDCEGDITVNFKVTGSSGLLGVVIDEDYKNKHVVKFTSGENNVALNTNLTKGYHKIRVVKLNECDWQTNSITFKNLGIIGTPDAKPASKTLKFEVYGDSITAGHGNLSGRSINGTFGYYQDGLKTYISLLAQKVGADLNVVAQSGMGIEYGYSDGGNIIANYWDKATPKSNSAAKWDFSSYTPDIVFINLGTNDTSMFGSHPTTSASIESTALTLIGNIRSKYPNCKIVWLEGMMGGYSSQISNGIASAISKTSDAYHIKDLPVGNNGGNWHPNEAEHQSASDVLYTKLKNLGLVE